MRYLPTFFKIVTIIFMKSEIAVSCRFLIKLVFMGQLLLSFIVLVKRFFMLTVLLEKFGVQPWRSKKNVQPYSQNKKKRKTKECSTQ